MQSSFRRIVRPLTLILALAGFVPLQARDAAPLAAPVPATEAPSWLYKGSDIPPDREWVFGELPNGLRYAVRRNGVPPHQVSIRMAIDAGSLNEQPGENGYAHFNEHLSFRGSRYVPDGEAKRLWQRLGATFGSDTNASTTPTQTIYKLDLPGATPEGVEESVKILSGMMAAPSITQAEVDAERRTVLAELRENQGPGQRAGDATRALFFAGQALGDHAPIGDVASLNAATPATLRGFHDRWYRPDRAVLVIVGDGDPATFAGLIAKYFGDWQGKGPAPADPQFGKPTPTAPRTKIIVQPGLPLSVNLAIIRPWVPKLDTIEYNRGKHVETLALQMIARRLETRARAGGSFLEASVEQQDISRSVDGTFIQVVPLGNDWQAAVRDVRAVIADALVNPASQAEIDREAGEFASALQASVEQAKNQNGGDLADGLVEAVNIRETVASPEVARDVFTNIKDRLNPQSLLAATRRMFSGTPMRALLTTPVALPGAEPRLLAALDADVRPTGARTAGPPVSFDRLPRFGPAATITKRAAIKDVGLELVELSNGVRLMVMPGQGEVGKIYVSVRFGRGMQGLPADRPTPAWAAGSALVASGIGDLGQDELDRLTSGRRINMGFDIAPDAFRLNAVTRAADLDDQLKLLAAKLAFPRWDAAPVLRTRAAMATGYRTLSASPSAVLGSRMGGLLHGDDPRWKAPTLEQIEALTPASFRALWEPLLKTGPIEVAIFGDVDAERAIASAAATFGALPARVPATVAPASAMTRGIGHNTVPLALKHTGPADQAMAALAWPTAGGGSDIYESRKLDILAAIFNDRMFDRLREGEGASYSPNVSSSWSPTMPGDGSFVVTAQVKPAAVDRFFALTREIAAQLASAPVTADELTRTVGPMRQLIARASSGNSFWLSQLGGTTTDPRRLQNLATLSTDYGRITAADLQATAKRWLVPDKSFAVTVLPTR